ncbi:MAG TPA: flagellar basal-body rod protein FlgF [Methylovirgula sp.]|nr:flagellar basal-body rod protein FlgF [Methylovirgula sp.]
MQSGLYVSLSAQMSLERRLESVAINVANMNTVGYRASGVSFHAYVENEGGQSVAYANSGRDYITRSQGPLIQTGNPLDVAVQGEGWLAVQTPGGTVYTRDGRMRMRPTGELESVDGHPILDAGNAPIVLDPTAGAPTISSDGMISQNNQQVGAIGLFAIDPSAKFTRYENSGVIPDKPATPILDFSNNGFVQGHVEGSNVNPILEMAKLMTISRTFESITGANASTEGSLKDAVKILGGTS